METRLLKTEHITKQVNIKLSSPKSSPHAQVQYQMFSQIILVNIFQVQSGNLFLLLALKKTSQMQNLWNICIEYCHTKRIGLRSDLPESGIQF